MKYLGLTDEIWVIDLESSSPVDLRKEGQYRYWDHPDSEVLLLAAKKLGSDHTHLWDFKARSDVLPRWFREILAAPPEEVLLAAANRTFDQQGLLRVYGATSDEKWLDILVSAYILGFSGRLDDVLRQSPLDLTKYEHGKRLINRFSVARERWHEYPDQWELFRTYCTADADVEERLLRWCLRWLNSDWMRPSVQRTIYQERVYSRINARGLPIDIKAVDRARHLRDLEISYLKQTLKDITGLDNPNSRNQFLGWLQERGYPFEDIRKDSVQIAVHLYESSHDALPKEVYDALKLRQEIGKTSVNKFDALSNATGRGDRLRGGWQFYGASRTGRVAGRILNPANLARPAIEDPELVADLLAAGTFNLPEDFKAAFPEKPLLDTLSSTIRACVAAPAGKKLCVADLTSIESVGAAWLAGCQSILDIFHAGRDTYKTFAAASNGIPYEEVIKEQRTFAKPAVLGGAYGLSGFGLVAYAQGMGVKMTEDEGRAQIAAFRDEYHELVHYWWQLKDAAIKAVQHPGEKFAAYAVEGWDDPWGDGQKIYRYNKKIPVVYKYDGTFLFCRLPSKRFLAYFQPEVDPNHTVTMHDGHTFTTTALTYMGIDQQATGQAWRRINTHGGKLLENVTQALCRDVLWEGLEPAEEDSGLEVLGDVYDELLTLSDEKDQEALDRLVRYMTTPARWMDERFFLGADGYLSGRYRKD